MKLRVLDLFSGIGGMSLGLERAGMQTVAFCEIDPFCRRVLAKHWPDVPCYEDIRTLSAGALSRDGIAVDVICGGFPCQDLSFAGKRAGLEGARSGLWGEYARLIGELRPRWVIIENVPGLVSGGDDVELPPDRCVCGWSSGWRGLHHDLPDAETSALSAIGCGHEREGAAGAAQTSSRVRGKHLRHAQGNREMGGGAWLAAVRPSAGSVPDGGASVLKPEAETGGARTQSATDDRWTAEEAEWLRFVDGASSEGCEDHSRLGSGGEPQGAVEANPGRMVCEACGRDMGHSAGRSVYSSWFGRVQRDLAAVGMHVVWDHIPACAVGAPHRRDRVWIVAHARGEQHEGDRTPQRRTKPAQLPAPDSIGDELRQQPRRSRRTGRQGEAVARDDGQARALADADKFARHEGRTGHAAEKPGRRNADRGRECEDLVANARREPTQVSASRRQPAIEVPTGTDRWEFEPDVGRVAHGVPARVDRLRALGNSVVPQIPEMIGRAILEAIQ